MAFCAAMNFNYVMNLGNEKKEKRGAQLSLTILHTEKPVSQI
jgi:hypothetical protein